MVVSAPVKMCEMRIMIAPAELAWFKEHFPDIKWEAGDTTIKWNANDPDEVKMAMKAYNAYKKKHPKRLAIEKKLRKILAGIYFQLRIDVLPFP